MPRGHPPGRRPGGCRHCDMVDDYRDERARQEREWGDGGFRDETSWGELVQFRGWLRHYPWPAREREAFELAERLGRVS